MSEARAARWPFVIVGLTALLMGAPFLWGGRVLYWGTPLLQFAPWRQFAVETLRAGHLPLWNPLVGNGAPLIANYQSALFYPPNWLMLIIPPEMAQGWLMVAHWAWAGAGMVMLARTLGLKPLGQVVAGLVFGVSQCVVARSGFLSINATVAWMPWVIWAGEHVVNSKSQIPNSKAHLRNGLWLALCVALPLLAGHAQTAWYTLLLLAAWFLWRVLTSSPFRLSLRVAAFLLLALGLAAVQLLPTAELLRQSPRAASAEYEFVMTYSLSPWRLLTFFAPDILGNPAHGVFYGYGNYWEDALYIGLLPILLALGVILRRQFSNSLILFLSLVSLATLLLALGRNTPLFPFLYRHVPTFNLFQAPARWLMVTAFALALLAGLGVDAWQKPRGRAVYWTNLGTAGAVMMALTGGGVWWATRAADTALRAQLHTVAQAVMFCGLGLFIIALLSLRQPPAESRRWQWAVVGLVALDLVIANYGLNPTTTVDVYRSPSATESALTAALDGHRLFYFPADEYAVKFDLLSFKRFGPPELASTLRAAQVPNAAMLSGLASANNFEPLVSARYAALMEVISATRSLNLLRLMDVGVVASPASLDWEMVTGTETVTFYRAPLAPQRVWMVYSTLTVPDENAALEAITAPNFDPAAEIILEPNPRASERACPAAVHSPNTVRIPVALPQPGWVLLADTDYPGWEADVDGVPTPVWRADYAFRAVAVEAGEHTVTFCYRPRAFKLGWQISAVAMLVWLGAWLYASRR